MNPSPRIRGALLVLPCATPAALSRATLTAVAALTTAAAPAVLLGALLSACQSAPTRLYTLYTVNPVAARADYGGPPIRVDAVHFPPSLDRIEVVHDSRPGEIALSDLDHWSAPLGEAARQALSADLVARLPSGKALYPHLRKPAGALGLSVDVLEFHTGAQGADLQASWVVSGAPSGASTSGTPSGGATSGGTPRGDTMSGGGTATLHTDAPASDAAATARALSTLLGQLADRIVAGL